jgi:hypothetical protein
MSMLRRLFLLAALAAVAVLPSRAEAAGCFCEHAGSQYDGICEAWPQGNGETYSWDPWGCAWLPWPTDPTSGMAYYDCQPGRAGGLNVVVTHADGSTSSASCGGWTGGE